MEDKVLAKIDEYEEFLKNYLDEEYEEEEDEEGPPGLQLDGVPFKGFTPSIKARIEKLEHFDSMS